MDNDVKGRAMLRVNWDGFAAAIRAQAIVDAKGLSTVQKELGLSHARMINAAQGKPVGTEIFLTICHWLQLDPLEHFVIVESQSHD